MNSKCSATALQHSESEHSQTRSRGTMAEIKWVQVNFAFKNLDGKDEAGLRIPVLKWEEVGA